MNQITVEYRPIKFLPFLKRARTSHPEKWDELTPKQLIIGASILNGTVSDDRVLHLMAGLSRKVIRKLDSYQKLRIIELLKFLNDYTPYHEFIILNLGSLVRPKPRLKHETFGTFIFAETYFLKYEKTYEDDDLCKFIACFYRDAKFNEETLLKNASLVKRQPEATKQAIYINYILIRQYLALNYPYVFTQSDDSDPKQEQTWLDVFDAIVKDDIVQQEKYADLPISTVLRYLNNQIKSGRSNEK